MRGTLLVALLIATACTVETTGSDSSPSVETEPPGRAAQTPTTLLEPSTTLPTGGKPSARTAKTTETIQWSSASLDDRPEGAPRPVRVTIPALGVAADIIAMGVDATGEMEVPENVVDVAWYSFGVTPGEAGSAVLAAHVDLAGAGPGVFYDLETMTPGDEITIGFGDGSEEVFSVIDTERVPKSKLDTASLFSESGPKLVRLVTCGGGFNPELRRYDGNVIVTLVSVEGVPR